MILPFTVFAPTKEEMDACSIDIEAHGRIGETYKFYYAAIETDRFSNYTLNYVESAGEGEDDTTATDTGDNSSPQMLIIFMVTSLLVILVVSKKKLVK